MKTELDFLPHISLTATQRKLLARLVDKRPSIVTHAELLSIWPSRSQGALNMALYNLRRKLKAEGYSIVAHRGLGYSFVQQRRDTPPTSPSSKREMPAS